MCVRASLATTAVEVQTSDCFERLSPPATGSRLATTAVSTGQTCCSHSHSLTTTTSSTVSPLTTLALEESWQQAALNGLWQQRLPQGRRSTLSALARRAIPHCAHSLPLVPLLLVILLSLSSFCARLVGCSRAAAAAAPFPPRVATSSRWLSAEFWQPPPLAPIGTLPSVFIVFTSAKLAIPWVISLPLITRCH